MLGKALIVIVATASMAATLVGNSAVTKSAENDAIAWNVRSCTQCHVQSAGLNHPVDVATSETDLPLGNGRIDCLTCHTEQTTSARHATGATQKQNGLLRKSAAALCSTCHGELQFGSSDGNAKSHGTALRKAHLGQKSSDSQQIGGSLDAESRQCLSCHDGSFASHSGVRTPNSGGAQSVSVETMHPIGVRYSSATKGRMAPQFQPVSSLPNTVRLFDGKVGCGSCHSMYASSEKMIAVDPKQGVLCLSCHIK